MSEQSVPTIGQVRDGYVWLSAGDNPGAEEAAGEDFDAAIAAHDREVKAAVWDEGFMCGIAYQAGSDEAWMNPYRIESEARP